MGRLTKRSNKTSHENGVCCTHFMSKECVQFGGECAWGCKWEEAAWGKLADYEDAEEQGLLLRLPCKIGRKVFYVQKCLAPSCKECKGFLRVDNCYCQYKARIFEQEFDYRHLKAFGKSVFLTKEEAEQALVKMEGENGKVN